MKVVETQNLTIVQRDTKVLEYLVSEKNIRIILNIHYISKTGKLYRSGNVKYWDSFGICLGKLMKAMKDESHQEIMLTKNTKFIYAQDAQVSTVLKVTLGPLDSETQAVVRAQPINHC